MQRFSETPTKAVFWSLLLQFLSILMMYVYFLSDQFRKWFGEHGMFRVTSFTLTAIVSLVLVWDYIDLMKVGHGCWGITTVVALFAGPMLQNFFKWKKNYRKHRWAIFSEFKYFDTWKAVVIAPIEEEIVYRAFHCTLWELAGIKTSYIIFLLPIAFGLSHIHFVFIAGGSLKQRIAVALVQLMFTTLFGWYAAFLWCTFHSVLVVSAVHIFCNLMGFPKFGHAINWPDPVEHVFIGIFYLAGICSFIAGVGFMATSHWN